jgi:eukaryotic-like serine/threonine-protein kinase
MPTLTLPIHNRAIECRDLMQSGRYGFSMALSGVADLTGRVLAARYRLLAPIGAGAGGRVYVADDTRLRRRVAVKVLHAALADDAGFLRRFRAEAQLAASLHHPNVMAVYDWGEDGVPFMVLELLEGGSLRGVLDRDVRLTPSQAAHIGRQVAAALEYSHTRGLVHRDIKPSNLLFDEHGIVRVADFGLARALAEASWTEPAGAVMGTTRYAAPEQATGSPLDGRADLYALALVLVESVTGRVPHVADTPLGTLAARAHQPVFGPPEMGALAPVIERAGRPDPAERYPDAATMGEALADAAKRLPPPGPLTLAGIGPNVDDPFPTQIGRSAVYDQDAELTVIESEPEVIGGRTKRRHDPATKRWVPAVVAAVLILALMGAGFALAGAAGGGTVAVPSLVGRTRSDAADRAARAGLRMAITERNADDPAGTVISQSPAAGGWTASGRIRVVVSRGPPPIPVPAVTNLSQADATQALQSQGFIVAPVAQFDEQVPKGTVLGTDPPGNARVARDSTVKLIVSGGPAPVTVKDVSTLTYDVAAQALSDRHLVPVRSDDFNDTVPVGVVIGTDPPAGKPAPRDSKVVVHVSKGPQLIVVPKLISLTVEAAYAELTSLGLTPAVSNYGPGKPVRAQDVAIGSQVKKGTTVTVFL